MPVYGLQPQGDGIDYLGLLAGFVFVADRRETDMKHSTSKPTKAEQERFRMLLEIGCIACKEQGYTRIPEIHHLLSGNRRRGHMFTIPLCPYHHRGVPMYPRGMQWHYLKYGPSLAKGSKPFRERFGTDDELLAKVDALIAERRAA